MKIMIMGSSGSGKSTYARKLGEALALPVYHLDAYYWKPGWVETPKEEWVKFNEQLVMKEEWIIDGHYGSTMDIRAQAADVIIYFDLSPWITTYRIFKRRIQYHGKTRPDLNEGCPESIDWPFIKYVWNFRRDKHSNVLNRLAKYPKDTKVIIIKRPKEAKRMLNEIKSQGLRYFEELESDL